MRFNRLYSLPGEGLVAELRDGTRSLLFDRQGLQHRIIELKKQSLDASAEEQALAQLNAYSSNLPFGDGSGHFG